MSTLLIIFAIIIILFLLGFVFLLFCFQKGLNNKYECDEIILKKRRNNNDNKCLQQNCPSVTKHSAEGESDL